MFCIIFLYASYLEKFEMLFLFNILTQTILTKEILRQYKLRNLWDLRNHITYGEGDGGLKDLARTFRPPWSNQIKINVRK